MEIDLTTPALLFSAISLIMLAYTNRFLSYAQLVRTLKDQYRENHSAVTAAQISNLRKRLYLTPCYAGDRYRELVALRGQYVFNVYTALPHIRIYFWTGTGAAHYFFRHFCPRDLYFRQGAGTASE